jgi:hypothetical protein
MPPVIVLHVACTSASGETENQPRGMDRVKTDRDRVMLRC